MKKIFFSLAFIAICFASSFAQLKVTATGVGIGNVPNPQAGLDILHNVTTTSFGFKLTDSGGSGGFFAVQDGTISSGAFLPTFTFSAKGGPSGFGGIFAASVPNAMDIRNHSLGATMLILVKRDNGATIQNANLFMLRNFRTPVLTVDKQGRLGIGTSVPSQKLHVNGDILANNVSVPSDRRLKKNITSFNLGLNEVLALQPITFQYNGSGGITDTETTHVGIIAQELEKLNSSLVTNILLQENSKEIERVARKSKSEDLSSLNLPTPILKEYLSVNDKSITYMLVNAIQEQQKMIKNQEQKINELELIVKDLLDK